MDPESRIMHQLRFLYGDEQGERLSDQLFSRMESFRLKNPHLSQHRQFSDQLADQDALHERDALNERDAILITYGDQVNQPGVAPLKSLGQFLDRHLKGVVSGVHLLPFYPYSSDDGFSVIDYWKVDPALGEWEDIKRMGRNYRLMFDAVINHISQHSDWFKGFLEGKEPYSEYFITADPGADLHSVVRPRTHPLLTPYKTDRGVKHVWTTFSSDQVDLNYQNPQVLSEICELLLFYVESGAEIIRLDAIAYLWKEIGTPSIHLPQTHGVIKLLRAILDAVAPNVILITETNVPHAENISYFGQLLPGSGWTDEAQMVYQFPLAPLTVHTLLSGSSRRLTEWAEGLDTSQPFFNFIASHDGIGLMPARGLLEPQESQILIDATLEHGGQVSYKNNPDGSQSVYELNITLFDLLNDPQNPEPQLDVPRFLASQAIMLSLSGVPGIYIHSLFGSRNCYRCLEETGRARSINREKFDLAVLEAELSDPGSHRARIFNGYRRMLEARRENRAFHPRGEQQVLNIGDGLFGVLRKSLLEEDMVLCLINVTSEKQTIPIAALETEGIHFGDFIDLISNARFKKVDQVEVEPYQRLWLKPE